MDCSPPGSSVHGIPQARILEWVAISFSRESSRPRHRTRVSRIAGRRFNLWATRETQGLASLCSCHDCYLKVSMGDKACCLPCFDCFFHLEEQAEDWCKYTIWIPPSPCFRKCKQEASCKRLAWAPPICYLRCIVSSQQSARKWGFHSKNV